LIHAIAVATGLAMTGNHTSTPAIRLSLPGVYFVWLLVLSPALSDLPSVR
jgi:hypothetical protein